MVAALVVALVAQGGSSATLAGASSPRVVPKVAVRPVTVLSSGAACLSGVRDLLLGGVRVPANSASVVLRVSVSGARASGGVRAYRRGGARPATASLAYAVGQRRSVDLTVALGTGGAVRVEVSGGCPSLTVVLVGYNPPPPPRARVVLGASTVGQGSVVIARVSGARCSSVVTDSGAIAFNAELVLADARTGRIVEARPLFTTDTDRGTLAARVKVPTWAAVGTYKVYLSCFSYFTPAVRFEPASVNVVAATLGPVAPARLVPAAVPSGVARAVRLVLPASCGPVNVDRTIIGSVRNVATGAAIASYSFGELTVPRGATTPAATLVIPRTAPVGRYVADFSCFADDGSGLGYQFEPAPLQVGPAAPRAVPRLAVAPSRVAAGGRILSTSGCGANSFGTFVLHDAETGLQVLSVPSFPVTLPVTVAPGSYRLIAFCSGAPRLPAIVTVLPPTVTGAARPQIAATPASVRAGASVAVSVDARYCPAGIASLSFPTNHVSGALVDRSTGRIVVARRWNVNRPFSFSTAGARAGSYLLYVSCNDPRSNTVLATFEPVAVTLSP